MEEKLAKFYKVENRRLKMVDLEATNFENICSAFIDTLRSLLIVRLWRIKLEQYD